MKAQKNNVKREIVAVLHNVRSLHNVGSIFRTADGAGMKKIYLCGITPSPVDRFGHFIPQFTKVSLGAECYVEWEKLTSTLRVLKKLKTEGYKILAVEQARNSVLYDTSQFRNKVSKLVLVMGAEVGGLPKSILTIADEILEIPMFGEKESLNVSVAFGIVAYELNQK